MWEETQDKLTDRDTDTGTVTTATVCCNTTQMQDKQYPSHHLTHSASKEDGRGRGGIMGM